MNENLDIFFEPEKDEGNIEYKLKLTNLSTDRINCLITQMKYRLNEGSGEAIYEIGIRDNGIIEGIELDEFNESIDNLNKIAKSNESKCILISKKQIKNKFIAEVLVRQDFSENDFIDISIVVAGNVDAGKTTTIGCLVSGVTDNGRGSARLNVLNYKHEIESGRTSSISHQILGFDTKGNAVNENKIKKMSWPEIVENSCKIITFYDLAGHEKYLRTTICGFSSTYPDYAMILVGANMGFNHMTKEHIALCLSNKIPFFIVITKIDLAPEKVLKDNLEKIKKLLNRPGVRKILMQIKNEDDAILTSKNFNENIVPLIEISNVTSKNKSLLKFFLNLLNKRKTYSINNTDKIEFNIDDKFTVQGIGTVVSGILLKGKAKINENVLIGPDSIGSYKNTQIKSIHYKRVNVESAKPGTYVCFNLKKISKDWVKKGMVIISSLDQPRNVWEFEAEISVLQTHHTTIKIGYEPNLHINNVSQACTIISIKKFIKKTDKIDLEDIILRAGDKALIKFKFKFRPAYIKEGYRIIFRENKLRGIGLITKIF